MIYSSYLDYSNRKVQLDLSSKFELLIRVYSNNLIRLTWNSIFFLIFSNWIKFYSSLLVSLHLTGFHYFCISIEITIECLVADVHMQNDLKKPFIKCLQLIARPLLVKINLSISTSGFVILSSPWVSRLLAINYPKFFTL